MYPVSLEVGSEVTLDIAKVCTRIKCEFIGMSLQHYIIIKIVNPDIHTKIQRSLAPETSVTIRCLQDGIVYAFVSTVISTLNAPDKLIFITYPSSVMEKAVRQQLRVRCNLPAKVNLDGEIYNGVVIDISRKGCLFTFSKSRSLRREALIAKCSHSLEEIGLQLQLPGVVADLAIKCLKRNLRPDDIAIGVEFRDMADEDTILLHEYLLNVDALPKHYNFTLAVMRHAVWMRRLRAFLDGATDVSTGEFSSSHECGLGRWLYSEGMKTYSYLEGMTELENAHNQLHNLANDLVLKSRLGPFSTDEKGFYLLQIDNISLRLTDLLTNLERQAATGVE